MYQNQKLTIVMYHYVRPMSEGNFPNLKALEINSFYSQLDYLEQKYNIVNTDEVIQSILKKKKLPKNACWLTFDDGYKDHIKYVMPELLKRKLTGAFFPVRNSTKERIILDANSIQHILSCSNNIDELVNDVNVECKKNGIDKDQIKFWQKKYKSANRFDIGDVMYIKKLLQYVLPKNLRKNIISKLLIKYVGEKKRDLLDNLYMNTNEVSELIKNGMFVGSHGSSHIRLGQLSEKEQIEEIKSSIEFLEEIRAPLSNWIMCYPFGNYNDVTIKIIRKFGALIGLTTINRKAIVGEDNPMELPRLDTNDINI